MRALLTSFTSACPVSTFSHVSDILWLWNDKKRTLTVRAVQLLCNSVQKFVISCKITISKLISQSKCRRFYDNDGGMNCPCTHGLSQANKPFKMQMFLWQRLRHELSVHAWLVTFSLSHFPFSVPFFYNFFSIWLTCNRTFYSFNMKLICNSLF